MPILRLALAVTVAVSPLVLSASSVDARHAHCAIGPSDSDKAGAFSIRLYEGDDDCYNSDGRHCSSNFNTDSYTHITGITVSDLAREGAQLTATVASEAGTFTCTGTARGGVLRGQSAFTPDPAFTDRMSKLGFSGFSSEKLEAYTLFDVRSDWVRSLQQAGVQGITEDNLLALRIFNVEPAYITSLTALGYPMPSADKLIALRVQKVDPEEVRQIRAMGYKPTLDDLIQIRIFHITPDFIHKMQDRGFKDLTLAKLVQIKIFKLDE